eukprot:TRINITY_DN46560_c0_g1_i1.p1 TRINITY_DN46560_c0_g1~~TRINITY_DN46560_c0_g1_i1.p1  ORF type:complete len:701 (-),score=52.68 TRINITY_DN46560_c0_g1_i1:226-2328(-)
MLERRWRWLVAVLLAGCLGWVFFLKASECLPVVQDRQTPDKDIRVVVAVAERPKYWDVCKGGEILVTMASSPARDLFVPLVIESMLHQTVNFDCMIVVLNNYPSVNRWFPASPRLAYHVPDGDLGACGKFFDRGLINRYKYHVAVDDDIVYPRDYIQRLITTLQWLQGEHLVGVHCRNMSLLANGALTWFGEGVNYDKPLAPQLNVSEAVAEMLFAAYKSRDKDLAHFRRAFEGGWTDLVGTGTFAYEVAKFDWTLEDIPPPGYVSDYHIAITALKQGLKSWCISRGDDWLQELPRAEMAISGIFVGLSKKKQRLVQLVDAVLQLDILYSERFEQNRSQSLTKPHIVRDNKREELIFPGGLLPMICTPYKNAFHPKWECRETRLVEIGPTELLWQVKLNESNAEQVVAASAPPPVIPPNCRTIHVVIPFGGPAKASAVALSVLSAAYQLYPCIVIWLVQDKLDSDDTSATYERLMDTTCRKSDGPLNAAFTTVKGAFDQDITVGCVHLDPPMATRDRGGPAYGKYAGYNISINYAKDTDIIFTLDGDDQLIHPQALSVVAEAYNQRGCWCTWGSMKGRYCNQRGPLPQDVFQGKQARPRKGKWVYTHPRSFLAKLFRHMSPADFQDDKGEWLFKTSDRGFVYRSIELSGPDRSCYLESQIYGYYTDRPGGHSTHDVSRGRKVELIEYVSSRTPSNRLLQL